MHSSLKIAAALLVNFSFLCHEVFAQLPPISFERYQSQPVGPSSPDPWDAVSGSPTVTPAGEGFGGGKALKIGVDPQEEAWLRKPLTWNPAETVAFIDFRIKPAATPSGSQANFFANGTQLAFQLPPNSTTGELCPDGTSDGVVLIEAEAHATNPRMHTTIRNKRNNTLDRWEDQHGRLVQSQDPSGQTTTFYHDVEGRLTQVKIDNQLQLINTYDPQLGYKTGVSDLSAGLSTSQYNGFGEVTKTTNARDQHTTTTYDSLGRVTSVEKPEGLYITTYRSTSPAKGQPASVSGPSGYLKTYSYGSSPHDYGQVIATSKRQSTPEQTYTTSTTYNALGLVWKETDAGGAEVTHEYVGGSFKLRSTMTAPQVSLLSEIESITTTTLTADTAAGFPASPVIRTREKLPHGVLRDTDTDARNGRLLRIFTTGLGRALGNPLQDLRYH